MKTMLIYREKYVLEQKDENDNIIQESHYEKEIIPFELDKVVRVRKEWNKIEVLMSDGKIVSVEDAEEIYFR